MKLFTEQATEDEMRLDILYAIHKSGYRYPYVVISESFKDDFLKLNLDVKYAVIPDICFCENSNIFIMNDWGKIENPQREDFRYVRDGVGSLLKITF